MGKFEDHIPDALAELDKQMAAVNRSIRALDWGHECDCEYCTQQTDIPEETELANKKLEAELRDLKRLKRQLIRHGTLHGILTP